MYVRYFKIKIGYFQNKHKDEQDEWLHIFAPLQIWIFVHVALVRYNIQNENTILIVFFTLLKFQDL